MATRRKRNLNFLPAETRPEPVIDISAYPVDIGVGELMRLTRERLGHELQTVANQLRIRLSYLEAIEDARFKDLPGTTYAVGFVRSYADYLGLDGADIVRRFREEAARIHGQTKLVFPALTAEGKLPRAAVLLVSAVGLAAVYGAWYFISSHEKSDLPVITDVPERLAVVPPDTSSANPVPPQPVEPSAPSTTTAEEPPASAPQAPTPVDGGTGTANAASPPESPPAVPSPSGAGKADPSASPSAAPVLAAPAQAAPPGTAGSTGTAAATPAAPVVGEPAVTTPPAATTGSTATAGAATPAAPDAVTSAQPAAGATSQAQAAVPPAGTSIPTTTPTTQPQVPQAAATEIPAAPSQPAITAAPAAPRSSPQVAEVPPAATQPAAAAPGVVLEAHMDSWIKVVDANNKTVTNQVLKAGERYVVPDQPGLMLRTGNAGGLDVLVNGEKAPALGDVGAVLTKVSLSPDKLLSGTAVGD